MSPDRFQTSYDAKAGLSCWSSSCNVAEAWDELLILLSLPSKCCTYRCVASYLLLYLFCIFKKCVQKRYIQGKKSQERVIYIFHSIIHSFCKYLLSIFKGQHQAGSRTEYNDQRAEFSFIALLLYSSTVQGYHWVKLGKRSAEVRILITSRRHDSRVKGFRFKSDSLLMVRNINLQQTLAYTLANAVYPLDSFLKCQPNTVERKSARVTTLWFWDGASARSTGSEFL